MRRLLFLLAITACAPAPPLVTAIGTPPVTPKYAVDGDSPAAAELRRQLETRGLYATDAPTVIHAGYARTPRAIGACTAPDPATGSCTTWFYPPGKGFAPLAAPLRYRLILSFDGGQLIVSQPGRKGDQPLARLTTAAIDRLIAP